MDWVTLVASFISVLAAVVSAWFARRNNVRELENTVDDVALWVEKAIRSSRAARMREVRAATSTPAAEIETPPELRPSATVGTSSLKEIKQALRAKAFTTPH